MSRVGLVKLVTRVISLWTKFAASFFHRNDKSKIHGTAVDLLADGASTAGDIISGHRPDMTPDQYLKFMRALASEENYRGE